MIRAFYRLGACLALLLCVPAASAADPAAPAPAAKPADSKPLGPPPKPVEREEWFRAGPDGPVSQAEQAWKAYKKAATSEVPDYMRYGFVVAEGPYAGRWELTMGENDKLLAALHMTFPEAPPYSVQVSVLCGTDAQACASAREQVAKLVPPPPDRNALMKDWRRVQMDGRCTPGQAVHMDPPPYPREEERRGVTGVVSLQFVNNACGEIVDIWIAKSSGNRNIDRSAINTARKWIIRVPDDRGGMAKTDISFSMDDSPALPAPTAPPAPGQ